MTRTFCVGEPPAELVELHATVERALDRALAAIRPGIKGSALDAGMTCDPVRAGRPPHAAGAPRASNPSLRRPLHPRSRTRRRARRCTERPGLGRGTPEELLPGDVVTVEPGPLPRRLRRGADRGDRGRHGAGLREPEPARPSRSRSSSEAQGPRASPRSPAGSPLVYVVWGSTYLGLKYAGGGSPPLLMLAARFDGGRARSCCS